MLQLTEVLLSFAELLLDFAEIMPDFDKLFAKFCVIFAGITPELGVVSILVKISQTYSDPPGVWIEPAKILALMAGLASSCARPTAALRD